MGDLTESAAKRVYVSLSYIMAAKKLRHCHLIDLMIYNKLHGRPVMP